MIKTPLCPFFAKYQLCSFFPFWTNDRFLYISYLPFFESLLWGEKYQGTSESPVMMKEPGCETFEFFHNYTILQKNSETWPGTELRSLA